MTVCLLGKTGYTVVAKNTLVTCAARNDMELICVTMKTEGRQVYVDTATLFDFCFDNFKKVDIGSSGTEGEEIEVSVKEGDSPEKTEKIPFRISEDGYVVLPSQAEFSDLKPLHFAECEQRAGGNRRGTGISSGYPHRGTGCHSASRVHDSEAGA